MVNFKRLNILKCKKVTTTIKVLAASLVGATIVTLTSCSDNSQQDSEDLSFLTMYDAMKNEDLLYSPYIQLRTDPESIITLLLNKDDYYKIAPTNYQNLIDTRKKIHVIIM